MLTTPSSYFSIGTALTGQELKVLHGATNNLLGNSAAPCMFVPCQGEHRGVSFFVAPVSHYQMPRNPEGERLAGNSRTKNRAPAHMAPELNDLFHTHGSNGFSRHRNGKAERLAHDTGGRYRVASFPAFTASSRFSSLPMPQSRGYHAEELYGATTIPKTGGKKDGRKHEH